MTVWVNSKMTVQSAIMEIQKKNSTIYRQDLMFKGVKNQSSLNII